MDEMGVHRSGLIFLTCEIKRTVQLSQSGKPNKGFLTLDPLLLPNSGSPYQAAQDFITILMEAGGKKTDAFPRLEPPMGSPQNPRWPPRQSTGLAPSLPLLRPDQVTGQMLGTG